MIKFENDRVFCEREIDYVLEHIVQNTNSPQAAMMKIIGELCKLLSDDQQKKLVASLDGYVQVESHKVPYAWNAVPESTEDDE